MTANVEEIVDPYDDPQATLFSLEASVRQNALAGKTKLHLRGPKLSEIGPEKFFFGAQSFCIVLAAVFLSTGLTPSLEDTKVLHWRWLALVFGRNYVIMGLTYGIYHHLFYESNYRKGCHKFNPRMPDPKQHTHDRFWTTVSMTWASCFEAVALYGWANGWFPTMYTSLWQRPTTEWLGLCLAVALFNDLHFYIIHRILHIGPIYRRVHKLHHLSKNPGPWSGMSMHPVEAILYISRVLLPLFLPHHPLHFYFSLLNTVLMPVAGHSGYEELLGNEYHWLHHHLFTCNYGSPAVPLDWLCNTHCALDHEAHKQGLTKGTTDDKRE